MRYAAVVGNALLTERLSGTVDAAPAAPTQSQAAVASTALADLLSAPARPAWLLGASTAALYLSLDGTAPEPSVIAVVAAGAVRLPLALVLAGPVPTMDGVRGGTVGWGTVAVGSLLVRPGRWFDPRPRLAAPFQDGPITTAARLLDELPAEASGVPGARVGSVSAALVDGNPRPALDLIGRGPGLTPAGDDVVAGILAAIALAGLLDTRTGGAVLAHAATATTSLSCALLRCAAAGQVIPQAAAFLAALTAGAPLVPSLDELTSVGATSGVALALGLVAGARAVLAGPLRTRR
ncbi:MAG: DUF2877 domain-containing protein [Candidatus Dormibacteraeota bacterium]|nr:DUF2877 domain-containing protein [Candidatus Dormibacteraeota bacterium]